MLAQLRKTVQWGLALVMTVSLLAGCGHGGGGGPTHPSLVGTYLGTAHLRLTAPQGSMQVNGGIQFVVSPDDTVATGDPGQPPVGSGPLTGNSFSIHVPGSFANSPGVNCGGTVIVDGSITGVNMSGTFSSSGLSCNGVPFGLTGTFSASLSAERLTQGTSQGALERLGDALRSR